jgi:hypothetical protein
VIVKNSVGGNGTFGYTGSGSGVSSSFNLTTVGGTTSTSFTDLAPGSKSVSETTIPSGWDLTNLSCSITTTGSGNSTFNTASPPLATVDLAAGDTVTCTFTNTKQASLVIVKNTVGGNGLFNYAGTGAGVSANFGLTTVAGTASTSFTNIALGTKTVTESVPSGWDLTSLSCSITSTGSGNSTFNTASPPLATVNLAAGDTVTCTFTNTKRANLVVVKNTVGGNGTFQYAGTGSGVSASFGLTTVGGTASTSFTDILPGSKSVTETVPSGWDLTSLSCAITTSGSGNSTSNTASPPLATVSLAAGDTVTCTFTNTKRASLTLVKTIVNDNGGTAVVSAFGITTSAGSPVVFGAAVEDPTHTFTYTSGTFTNLVPGSKTLHEGTLGGYTEGTWSCNGGGAVNGNAQTGSVVLLPGEAVTCSITNNDQPGTIIIRKITDPLESNTVFNFDATGPLPSGTDYADFTLTGVSTGNPALNINSQQLNAGNYTVTEANLPGWVLTGVGSSGSSACEVLVQGSNTSSGTGNTATATASITLGIGDTIRCTFENTQQGGTTRTQGFWATHSQIANVAWYGGTWNGTPFPGVAGVPSIGDRLICGRDAGNNPVGLNLAQLMGGFWSNISKDCNNGRRSTLDQARMKLLQQLLAAELNASAFGTLPSIGSYAAWESAFCGTDIQAINLAQSQAAAFNEAGDSGIFTPGTAADAKHARAIADECFWNAPAGAKVQIQLGGLQRDDQEPQILLRPMTP